MVDGIATDEHPLVQCKIWLLDGVIKLVEQPPNIGSVLNLTFTEEQHFSDDCRTRKVTSTSWKILGIHGFPFHLQETAFFIKSEDGFDIGYTWVSNEDLRTTTCEINEETFFDISWPLKSEDDELIGCISFKMCVIPRWVGEDTIELYRRSMSHVANSEPDSLGQAILLARDSGLKQLLLNKCGWLFLTRFFARHQIDDDLKPALLVFGIAACFDERVGAITESAQVRMAAESSEGRVQRDSYEQLSVGYALSFEEDDTLLHHLSLSITIGRQLIQFYHNDNKSLSRVLTNLGHSLWRRFQAGQSHNLQDIAESIHLHQKAIGLVPMPDTNHMLPVILVNFGQAALTQCTHTLDPELMSKGVSALQQALVLTPTDDPNRPNRMMIAATGLIRRSEQSGHLADAFEAIRLREQAIKMLPPGDSTITVLLSGLGQCWYRLFSANHGLEEISKSIAYYRQADNHITTHHVTTHPFKSFSFKLHHMLNEYGIALTARYRITHSEEDFREADAVFRKVLSNISDNDITRPTTMLHFTTLHSERWMRSPELASLPDVLATVKLITSSSTGTPVLRMVLTSTLASLQSLLSALPSRKTLQIYASVIDMLPQLASFEHTVEVRHQQISRVGTMALAGVADAISCDELGIAVEWLERARCWVWNQLNQLRTPLGAVRMQNAELADRLDRINQELDALGSRSTDAVGFGVADSFSLSRLMQSDTAYRHVMLAKELDQAVDEVRATPGFEHFLRPPTIVDLLGGIPNDGPVILLNIDIRRCDAIVLMPHNDEPLLVPLTAEKHRLEELCQQLRGYLTFRGLRSRNVFPSPNADTTERAGRPRVQPATGLLTNVLRYLWTQIVQPILDILAFSPSSTPTSRIWWCPTGALAFLPLHAAGLYDKSSKGPCLSDYAVSSYIPTISSLIEKSKITPQPSSKLDRLLLVSQADAPGLPSIPGTSEEVALVATSLRASGTDTTLLEDKEATVDAVTSLLRSHNAIHLACHAVQDPHEPLRSGFFMQDGRLDLAELIKQRAPQADLAFLSACQTSVGAEELPEEMVHLAAGMLAAGYKNVVATTWSIQDAYGPQIAANFYCELMGNGGGSGLDTTKSAHALHSAIQMLRNNVGDSEFGLLAWVPYVHFGA